MLPCSSLGAGVKARASPALLRVLSHSKCGSGKVVNSSRPCVPLSISAMLHPQQRAGSRLQRRLAPFQYDGSDHVLLEHWVVDTDSGQSAVRQRLAGRPLDDCDCPSLDRPIEADERSTIQAQFQESRRLPPACRQRRDIFPSAPTASSPRRPGCGANRRPSIATHRARDRRSSPGMRTRQHCRVVNGVHGTIARAGMCHRDKALSGAPPGHGMKRGSHMPRVPRVPCILTRRICDFVFHHVDHRDSDSSDRVSAMPNGKDCDVRSCRKLAGLRHLPTGAAPSSLGAGGGCVWPD